MESLLRGKIEKKMCVICGQVADGNGRELRSKGTDKLNEIPQRLQHVEIIKKFDRKPIFWVRNHCYKTYTAPKNIVKKLRKNTDHSETSLRSAE